MSSRIAEVFAQTRAAGRLAFMPFLTAGDPHLAGTGELIQLLGRSGADLIELGFPYSDPIADGPVIQGSYTRALRQGLKVPAIFDMLAGLPADELPPIVAMTSFALVWRTGVESFLARARSAGVSGLIVPDLPGAEAAELFAQCQAAGLDLVQLIAPTTPRARVKQILKSCSGFVYCVAIAGTTGAREQVADALLEQLDWLREETDLPLAVGFGISRPEHVRQLQGRADGAIVGSALVKQLEPSSTGGDWSQTMNDIEAYIAEMAAATRSA